MGPISEIGIAFFCRYGWSPVAVGAGARAPLADVEAEAPPPALIDIIWLLGISAIGSTIQPTCRVRLGQQPAGQVVLVPSRHDEHDRSSRPQPRQQIGLPPIPMMGPGCSASARGGRRGRAPDTMPGTISRRRFDLAEWRKAVNFPLC